MQDNSKFIHSIEEISNLYEIYGEKKQEKIKFKQISGVIIDIGAHIGIFSIKFAKKYKEEVYAIEPEKENFEKLKTNIKLNNLQKNIHPIRIAIFDKKGFMRLGLSQFGSGAHSLFNKTGITSERVRVTTLDYMRKKLNKKIALIKIDTEGSEYKILMSSLKTLKKDKPKLIIETHPIYDAKIDNKILSLLRQLKYNFRKSGNTEG
jgi:FkbM family methyltransferase